MTDIISPTHSPVRVEPLGSTQYPGAQFGGSSNIRPRIRRRNIPAVASTFVLENQSISEPTIVKLGGVVPTGGNLQYQVEAYWRRYGGSGQAIDDLTALPFLAIPFFGPYAYFETPGDYELIFHVRGTPVGGITSAVLQLTIVSGLDPQIIDSLLDPARANRVSTGRLALGVAGTGFVDPDDVPVFKSISFFNLGANPGDVTFGRDTNASLVLPVADSAVTLGPDVLGRQSMLVTSALGTTIAYVIGKW